MAILRLGLGFLGFLGFLGLGPGVWAAERPALLMGRPQVQIFTDRDGLRQNSVEAVAMDNQGYAWIGTQDGAMRYDGRRWTPVDMPDPRRSNWVTSLVISNGGPRWFGTNNAGVARWNGAWATLDSSLGLPSDMVHSLIEGLGTVWVGTAKGPARWTGERWEPLWSGSPWPGGAVRALLLRGTAQVPEVWVGSDQGLAILAKGQWRWFGTKEGLPSRSVTALLEGEAQGERRDVWVGTLRGLAQGEPGRFKAVGSAGLLPHPAVVCLKRTLSREGRPVLWVGTERGLLRWEGDQRQIWGQAQGLASPVMRSLMVLQDVSGRETVWAGTFGGLVRFTEGTWTSLETQDGLPDNTVFAFHEEARSGSLWFGTYHGLVSYEGGRWLQHGPAEGLPQCAVFALEEDAADGSLWIGTKGEGLFHRVGGRAVPMPGLPDSWIYALHASRDADGVAVLWVGTRVGLSKWREGTWTHLDPRQGRPSALVSSITETRGADGAPWIWVGTRGVGLGVLEPGRKTWAWFDASNGLVDGRVMHLLPVEEGGRPGVWVSTQGGLQRFQASPLGPTNQILSRSSKPALPSDLIYTARRGLDGSLYAFTSRGIWRGLPRPGGDWEPQTFTTGDGLPSNGCAQGSSLVDASGRIWAGTLMGVAILDPTVHFVDTQIKPLILDGAFNGERQLSNEGPWHLSWRARNLKVRFSLLSYHREADTRFRSQLVNLEAEPTPWVAGAEREFVSLPAGHFVLRYWGRDHAGNVSGPFEVPLTVEAPPWLRAWAVVLYILALTLAVLGLILWRVGRLQRINLELEERVHVATGEIRRQNESLARVNHHLGRLNEEKSNMLGIAAHDLRNPLNGIVLYADSLRGEGVAPDVEHAANRIMKLGKDMTQLIERLLNSSKIDEGHLSLHMGAVDVDMLFLELVERHRATAQAKGLLVVTDLPPEGVPPVLADPFHLMEAMENLVGNALKFMPPGPPLRRVILRARAGVIEVQDEGPGFTAEDLKHAFERFRRLSAKPTAGEGSTGLGLSIVKALVEAMGGEIELLSEPGQGATFRITLGRV